MLPMISIEALTSQKYINSFRKLESTRKDGFQFLRDLDRFLQIRSHINMLRWLWVHVILREASFSVGLVAACRWPIVTATVIILQNYVSVGL